MPKDKSEKKSKKDKQPVVVDAEEDGDVSMVAQEAVAVEVVKVSLLWCCG
jgi:hypothetical protein